MVWALTLRGRTRRGARRSLALAGLALLAWTAGPRRHAGRRRPRRPAARGERWQPWEPGRVEQLLAAGQPVFVDFTAAWCVTCQYNKKTTLADADVLADFDAEQRRPAARRLDPARPGHHRRARRSWAAAACRST